MFYGTNVLSSIHWVLIFHTMDSATKNSQLQLTVCRHLKTCLTRSDGSAEEPSTALSLLSNNWLSHTTGHQALNSPHHVCSEQTFCLRCSERRPAVITLHHSSPQLSPSVIFNSKQKSVLFFKVKSVEMSRGRSESTLSIFINKLTYNQEY